MPEEPRSDAEKMIFDLIGDKSDPPMQKNDDKAGHSSFNKVKFVLITKETVEGYYQYVSYDENGQKQTDSQRIVFYCACGHVVSTGKDSNGAELQGFCDDGHSVCTRCTLYECGRMNCNKVICKREILAEIDGKTICSLHRSWINFMAALRWAETALYWAGLIFGTYTRKEDEGERYHEMQPGRAAGDARRVRRTETE
jgi:hypothetical protein